MNATLASHPRRCKLLQNQNDNTPQLTLCTPASKHRGYLFVLEERKLRRQSSSSDRKRSSSCWRLGSKSTFSKSIIKADNAWSTPETKAAVSGKNCSNTMVSFCSCGTSSSTATKPAKSQLMSSNETSGQRECLRRLGQREG
ncbi:hypothetical protein BDZ89DRAFT_492696 [Hymenopellis radicata]|nr:hypothetical protein BDZ89DRAFT_492696 [Hymenopellis radicata]